MNFIDNILSFFKHNKVITVAISVTIIVSIIIASFFVFSKSNDNDNVSSIFSSEETSEMVTTTSEEPSSDIETSQTTTTSKKPSSSVTTSKEPDPVTSAVPVYKPTANGEYKYNTNLDVEDNLFMDALVYTGYNLEKHRADGKMWVYILARYKRGYGWLSNITFGGGSSGYEVTSEGKPNIKAFEKGGLVCASYVTYNYFNYLPNVAGIDTSMLPRPESSVNANDWYKAAKKWIELGYSYSIPFDARTTSSGYIDFKPHQEIPIGSILIFRSADHNRDYGNHAVVYAGYKNGNHWVYHTGNKNGPEMCAVERMMFGPDPVFPIYIISTPSVARMSAILEVSVKDQDGNAISNVPVTLKNKSNSSIKELGATNSEGKISIDKLSYIEYELSISVPDEYNCDNSVQSIKLTPNNNSLNHASFTLSAQKGKTANNSEVTTSTTSQIDENE